MTCREKLKAEHPDWDYARVDEEIAKHGCPHYYNYLDMPSWCTGGASDRDCEKCWDREVPEPKPEITDACFEEDGYSPKIKDSGNRTQFETGAVRDMRTGKGRCDLIPLNVMADIMPYPPAKEMLHNVYSFQVTRDSDYLKLCIENFARNTGESNNFQADLCTLFLEVAKHFEEGALKYGESNWQKGIPVYCYIDSAVRHYLKWLRGDNDERHDRAFVWNLLCCIWEVDYHKTTVEEATE